ncbi:uncharacterized protein LOC143033337 [Oratosquilla oratoria]|uniref:uncharacterized protein LOC143033337 n=1 Tax=Oratosquilla oratoria TaxID=337810 RepID=UPI003F767662
MKQEDESNNSSQESRRRTTLNRHQLRLPGSMGNEENHSTYDSPGSSGSNGSYTPSSTASSASTSSTSPKSSTPSPSLTSVSTSVVSSPSSSSSQPSSASSLDSGSVVPEVAHMQWDTPGQLSHSVAFNSNSVPIVPSAAHINGSTSNTEQSWAVGESVAEDTDEMQLKTQALKPSSSSKDDASTSWAHSSSGPTTDPFHRSLPLDRDVVKSVSQIVPSMKDSKDDSGPTVSKVSNMQSDMIRGTMCIKPKVKMLSKDVATNSVVPSTSKEYCHDETSEDSLSPKEERLRRKRKIMESMRIPAPGTNIAKGQLRRAGPYLLGPRQGSSPVSSIVQCLARKENTDEFYLIKILTLQEDGKDPQEEQGKMLLHTEYTLLSLLQHQPGVIHHHGLFEDYALGAKEFPDVVVATGRLVRRLCLVLDCLTPHDYSTQTADLINMQHYVINEKKLKEKDALIIFHSIVKVVQSLHEQNIVHRDLKLGNLVLHRETREVTITNFCLGQHLVNENDKLRDQRGSPAYISPDVLSGKPYLGKPSDMWALGVVLFTMLYGHFPFYDEHPHKLFRKIKAAHYRIPSDNRVSSDTIGLIQGLLELNPLERLTCDQVLSRLRIIVSRCSALLLHDPVDPQVVPDIDNDSGEKSAKESKRKYLLENSAQSFGYQALDKNDLDQVLQSAVPREESVNTSRAQSLQRRSQRRNHMGSGVISRITGEARHLTKAELTSLRHVLHQNQRGQSSNSSGPPPNMAVVTNNGLMGSTLFSPRSPSQHPAPVRTPVLPVPSRTQPPPNVTIPLSPLPPHVVSSRLNLSPRLHLNPQLPQNLNFGHLQPPTSSSPSSTSSSNVREVSIATASVVSPSSVHLTSSSSVSSPSSSLSSSHTTSVTLSSNASSTLSDINPISLMTSSTSSPSSFSSAHAFHSFGSRPRWARLSRIAQNINNLRRTPVRGHLEELRGSLRNSSTGLPSPFASQRAASQRAASHRAASQRVASHRLFLANRLHPSRSNNSLSSPVSWLSNISSPAMYSSTHRPLPSTSRDSSNMIERFGLPRDGISGMQTPHVRELGDGDTVLQNTLEAGEPRTSAFLQQENEGSSLVTAGTNSGVHGRESIAVQEAALSNNDAEVSNDDSDNADSVFR